MMEDKFDEEHARRARQLVQSIQNKGDDFDYEAYALRAHQLGEEAIRQYQQESIKNQNMDAPEPQVKRNTTSVPDLQNIYNSIPKSTMSTYNASQRIKDYKAISEKNDGKSYFDILSEKRKEDPEAFTTRMAQAQKTGKEVCRMFLDKCKDFNHPEHEKCYARFKNEFGNDPQKAESHFVNDTANLYDAHDWQVPNKSYESKMLSTRDVTRGGVTKRLPLDVNTIDDSAIISKYRTLMQAKWSAVGYKNDDEEAAAFWSTHQLSGDAQPTATPQAQRDAVLSTKNSAASVMNDIQARAKK